MIKRLTLKKEVHPFPMGTDIKFVSGLNIICGDQGTGKSTILDMMMMHDREFVDHITLEQDGQYRAFAFYSSEYHNPRTIDGGLTIGETRYNATLEMFFNEIMNKIKNSRFANTQHFGQIAISAYQKCKNMSMNVVDKKLVDLDVITKSALQSHGQALFPFLEAALQVQGGIVFLDEPETSLSIRSQLNLAEMLQTAAIDNQIFMATHSEILIKSINEHVGNQSILSLDEPVPTWIKADKFIDKHYEN